MTAVKKGLIEGIRLDPISTPEFCDACTKAKAVRQPFLEESQNRVEEHSGDAVDDDILGEVILAAHHDKLDIIAVLFRC